jgi:hypothetical protein
VPLTAIEPSSVPTENAPLCHRWSHPPQQSPPPPSTTTTATAAAAVTERSIYFSPFYKHISNSSNGGDDSIGLREEESGFAGSSCSTGNVLDELHYTYTRCWCCCGATATAKQVVLPPMSPLRQQQQQQQCSTGCRQQGIHTIFLPIVVRCCRSRSRCPVLLLQL